MNDNPKQPDPFIKRLNSFTPLDEDRTDIRIDRSLSVIRYGLTEFQAGINALMLELSARDTSDDKQEQ